MDNWHLHKIPKIVHFYWAGKPLSYIQFLTIYTFWRLNPDWEIQFHIPVSATTDISWDSIEQKYKFSGRDWFKMRWELPIKSFTHNFERYGLSNTMSEVHKSDFLRWHLLSTTGGLWSDMDILYSKPIDCLDLNILENCNIDTIVSICRYGHSIGFLLSSPGNEYFRRLFELAKSSWKAQEYQSVGVNMINGNFRTTKTISSSFPKLTVSSISMDTVYPFNASRVNNLFTQDNLSVISEGTIGLHWYAGHKAAGEFLNKSMGGETNLPKCSLTSFLKICPQMLCGIVNSRITSDDTILDIGCGDKVLSSQFYGKVTTLDVWPKFNPDVVHDLNTLPLPFEDKSFDFVTAFDIVEHLDKEHGKLLLEELKRIARKSVLILTPLWWTENEEAGNDPKSAYYQNHYNKHKSLWTVEDFSGWNRILGSTDWKEYFVGEFKCN